MRIVVYTAIFGGYDDLIPQPKFEGVDFICFTDRPIQSDIWDVRVVPGFEDDTTRSSRMHKLLPHQFLSEYDLSIFIDGNYTVN